MSNRLLQKLKCMIGWHVYRVYGHVLNLEPEVADLIKEHEEADDPLPLDSVSPSHEYYYVCVHCDRSFWDYQYLYSPLRVYSDYKSYGGIELYD